MVVKKSSRGDAPGVARSFPPNLPKKERIADQKKIRSLFANKYKLLSSGPIAINTIPDHSWGIAIIVNKRAGPAVRRNRIKRKLREAYRHWKPHCTRPYSVLFRISQPIDDKELNNVLKILYTRSDNE